MLKSMCGLDAFLYADMVKKVLKALVDETIMPLATIHRFFRKARDYMRTYKSGSLAYRDVKIALKTYKSH